MALRVGIIGGSGYTGGELLRLLLFHPQVEIAWVTAHDHAGRSVGQVHPNLRHLTELSFEPMPPVDTIAEKCRDLNCLFLALPHTKSMEIVPAIPREVRIIDLAGDFRLRDARQFEIYYGRPHRAPHSLEDFVYGLTEINRDAIASSLRVANPGCFATAVLLGVYPFVATGLIQGPIVADAKTGSSGAGATPSETTHHPRRANSFFAYKPLTHQHLPEILQVLRSVNPDWNGDLLLQVHSAPVVRGIFATLYLTATRPLDNDEIRDLFAWAYGKSFFVRLLGPNRSPDITWVKHTNFADIGWAVQGSHAVIFVAIDNLVKGAAGQAVQNMNVMFGLEETTGLRLAGSNP
ncbi:MAG TPA: N-acetyl-gamma-glutamyl-phosphate reductase [Blastocatellia bacterium]|nr:N-acetyl-gamma-glutamyl-phosphate reductase [Blastocatellia bacterium]